MSAPTIDSARVRTAAAALQQSWGLVAPDGDLTQDDLRAIAATTGELADAADVVLAEGIFDQLDNASYDLAQQSGTAKDGRITYGDVTNVADGIIRTHSAEEILEILAKRPYFDFLDLALPDHFLNGNVAKEEIINIVNQTYFATWVLQHLEPESKLELRGALKSMLDQGLFEQWAQKTGDPTLLEAEDIGITQ
jgi:hypothetical protein